jgi:hypothetical protein
MLKGPCISTATWWAWVPENFGAFFDKILKSVAVHPEHVSAGVTGLDLTFDGGSLFFSYGGNLYI